MTTFNADAQAQRGARRAKHGGEEAAAVAVAAPPPMTMQVADPSKPSGKRQVVRPEDPTERSRRVTNP